MKNKNDELMRVETMLNSDRLRLKDDFIKLLECDLSSLLSEYFYLNSVPVVEMEKDGKEFLVRISFSCSQIKSFINIPN